MVLDPIPQSLPVHFFGSRPQPPTSLDDTAVLPLQKSRICLEMSTMCLQKSLLIVAHVSCFMTHEWKHMNENTFVTLIRTLTTTHNVFGARICSRKTHNTWHMNEIARHTLITHPRTYSWNRIAHLAIGRWNYMSLLQKSPIKETIFCKRDLPTHLAIGFASEIHIIHNTLIET